MGCLNAINVEALIRPGMHLVFRSPPLRACLTRGRRAALSAIGSRRCGRVASNRHRGSAVACGLTNRRSLSTIAPAPSALCPLLYMIVPRAAPALAGQGSLARGFFLLAKEGGELCRRADPWRCSGSGMTANSPLGASAGARRTSLRYGSGCRRETWPWRGGIHVPRRDSARAAPQLPGA